ncbi:MAG: hypothetical protein U5K54_00410 [Cytophagales bacterium]|nr:hypothetical protein [Cytophagales bacterium]
MGIKDLGYVGNKPNQWDGVPQEVLDQYGVKYDERTLTESVKFDLNWILDRTGSLEYYVIKCQESINQKQVTNKNQLKFDYDLPEEVLLNVPG